MGKTTLALTVLLALLLFSSPLAAQITPVPASPSSQQPTTVLKQQVDFAMSLMGPVMMLLVMIAALVYGFGRIFGGDVQARATVWATSMLTAVAVAAVLIVVLLFFLPIDYGLRPDAANIENTVKDLKDAAQSILGVLIILLIVISALVYTLGQAAGAETRARAAVWSTNILVGALLSAVIYVLVFEVFSSFQSTLFAGTQYNIFQYGQSIIIPVAFFVSAIILITYMISRVFNVPEWEAYLSIELSNLAGSFVVLVFVLGFFAVASAFSATVTDQPSAPQGAIQFLRVTVANDVLTGMYDVFKIQTCTSMLSTFSKRIGEAALTNVFKVFPGIDTFVSITNVVGYGLVAIYGSLAAQITLMNLIDASMAYFILPAGLVLRFFPPTRDAGSFLVALAFGFQFVFPMIYIINAMVLKDLSAPTYVNTRSELLIQSLCGPFKFGVAGILLNPNAVPRLFSYFPGMSTLFKSVLSESLLNLLPMLEFVPIMQSVALLSLFALFIPAFALVITIAFINAMTKFLTTKV